MIFQKNKNKNIKNNKYNSTCATTIINKMTLC